MKRKVTALLLSALVLPGLGQLYLGRKGKGVAIIMVINLILLLGLFVVLKGLSPVIAAKIAGGSAMTVNQISEAIQQTSTFGRGVLAAFVLVWVFALVDVAKTDIKSIEQDTDDKI